MRSHWGLELFWGEPMAFKVETISDIQQELSVWLTGGTLDRSRLSADQLEAIDDICNRRLPQRQSDDYLNTYMAVMKSASATDGNYIEWRTLPFNSNSHEWASLYDNNGPDGDPDDFAGWVF